MHRIAATPGGWNPQGEGVIVIEQTPAPIIFMTAADTDIQTITASTTQLPVEFPPIRVVNLLHLQQQLTIDTYAETVLAFAQIIILRLLGGRSYWSYGLEVVQETVQQTGATLIVLPGDDRYDSDLIGHSTVSLAEANQLWRYFTEGGVANFTNALEFIADLCLGQTYNPPPPIPVPRVGIYPWVGGSGEWGVGSGEQRSRGENSKLKTQNSKLSSPKIGIIFYRAHYLAGNTSPIDALCQALTARNLTPVPIFVSSLQDAQVQATLIDYFQPQEGGGIELLLATTSFSVAKLDSETPELSLWKNLDVPVFQVILSGGTIEQWDGQFQGLTPRDTAMNVALPEVDGRIITRAVSFKSVQTWHPLLETDVVVYEPVRDRIEFVADLALNWIKLRQTPVQSRRVALILANYPNRDGRLANGVGLDTPASCVEILKALQESGYLVENIPKTGDELITLLTSGITNDPEGWSGRLVRQYLDGDEYSKYFNSLPLAVQTGICDRWSQGEWGVGSREWEVGSREWGVGSREWGGESEEGGKEITFAHFPHSPFPTPHSPFPIPGIQLGNIFIGIQPSRGYDLDPSLNYHAPDLEPTTAYLAFYYWLRQKFAAQAIVHVGKHGNLEWLPGKSVALSGNCYPEVALGAMPHFYPFIVNDPGEGSQAKRRSQAVIIDHLTPPMTRAQLYGSLQQLEGLVDEYYEAQSLDPSRLPLLRDRITQLIERENLAQEWGVGSGEWGVGSGGDEGDGEDLDFQLNRIDSYLCELKEAQIRDGLHIFGKCPEGRQLRDLIVAIARHPGRNRLGLTRAIAKDWGWDFDPLIPEVSNNTIRSNISPLPWEDVKSQNIRSAIEELEEEAAKLVEELISRAGNGEWGMGNGEWGMGNGEWGITNNQQPTTNNQQPTTNNQQLELDWIRDRLLPALQQTNQEITQLLRGLDGRYVPSGAAGAPTRGRPEVLPTGRNFYSVDIRAIPTETAWDVGRKAAEALIERYTQENGEYPKTLGMSVWGTSTMRTGGDDIAEALALLGVRPVWDGLSRRVVDFEILTLSALGRPRVDVTLRISGFFRDAFPNLIDLFYNAVVAVSSLNEPLEQNPLAAQVQTETEFWQEAGLSEEEASVRSRYRIFGSKPGAYGAGLQGLIEGQNWTDEEDLARAYLNWSSYAYGEIPPLKNEIPPYPPLLRQENMGENAVENARASLPIPKSEVGAKHLGDNLSEKPKGDNPNASPSEGLKTSLTPNSPLKTEKNTTPPLNKGGVAAPEAFAQRLKNIQIVLHNQDNREHDLLDSDDYYQFQGGMTVAVRALTGKNPQTYFGDNSIPENPRVRHLREEIAKVYRSRVINPKWIEGVMRHGYKGAFEMAATVDYLFAYDATANCVEDYMYQGVADAYLFDSKVQKFIQEKNPWALRDMAERLLEAHKRNLWQSVSVETLEELRLIALQAEGVVENRGF